MKIKLIILIFVFNVVLLQFFSYRSTVNLDFVNIPRYFQTRTRILPDVTIFLFYKEMHSEYKYWATISFSNNIYYPTTLSFNGIDAKTTKYYAIYSLKNRYVIINNFNGLPDVTDLEEKDNDLVSMRKICLIYDPDQNVIFFPEINKSNMSKLHLALHAYYVLTHYLESAPIKPYSSSDGRSIPVNALQEYSIKVMDRDAISTCHYNPDRKDINVSTKWKCSYYDSVYKHEYGHHIYHTIFEIKQKDYTKDYDIYESCDEQTAVNEGFSYYLMNVAPFDPYLVNDSYVQLNLDPTQDYSKEFDRSSRWIQRYEYISTELFLC